jgi:hypothetical protein
VRPSQFRAGSRNSMIAFMSGIETVLLCAVLCSVGFCGEVVQRTPPPQVQVDEYSTQIPKTVIELQPFRRTSSVTIHDAAGREGRATLINLNPRINAWFLLFIQSNETDRVETYHLENPRPTTQTLRLDQGSPETLQILSRKGTYACGPLWYEPSSSELTEAAGSGMPYGSLCDDRLLVRNKTKGHKTTLEKATDLLRNHVWQGEKITTFVRETFYQDAYLDTSELIKAERPSAGARPRPPGAPARPLMNPDYSNHFLVPDELDIALETETGNRLLIGRWYRAKDLAGVFVSVTRPNLVASEVIEAQRKRVNPLDEVESNALVYMVAFDLDLFDLGFEMGTEHPRVDWSDRVPDQVRDNSLPGPDGIGTLDPLVMTGMVSPAYAHRTAATFIGGFKRYHGAFRWADLSLKNHGSHYGFIEHGVVLSKLQPSLSTVLVFEDGTVDLKTWSENDNADLERIRHARQNGVPIIEYDAATETSTVGHLVPHWGQGNWSGSVDQRFRTVRAGLGLHVSKDHRFLIYGYFSGATPSAMARVFQAYHCRYAMILDINALEHTYLAVYKSQDMNDVQHLVKGMSVLDKTKEGQIIPRFLGYADNRDFFYLFRKENL